MDPRDADRDLLSRLMATEPVSGRSNAAIIDVLRRHFSAAGIRVETPEAHAPDRWNLIARTGPPVGPDRDGLTLSGHLDVVPPGEGWSSPPFRLTETDGLWYGRGTCDMLGFVAMAANLLVWAARERIERPIALLLSADEEVGSLGAAALAGDPSLAATLPRAVVVGEPTRCGVVRMHKGHAKRAFVFRGTSAHSGTPHMGRSAIEAMGPVLSQLAALRRRLAAEGGPNAACFPSAPHPVINLGRIEGGTAINVVAESARLEIGVRPLPGQHAEDLFARVRRAVAAGLAEAAEADPVDVAPIAVAEEDLGENPPLETPADASIVRRLMDLTGQREDRGATFASDGGHLARGLGMNPVLWGPGDMGVAHRPDEHLDPAELDAARAMLMRLLADPAGSEPATAAATAATDGEPRP